MGQEHNALGSEEMLVRRRAGGCHEATFWLMTGLDIAMRKAWT